MKIAFFTLGCKVNQYETQSMREKFAALGHTYVENSAPFDAAIINSCTVTAESDRKTRQLLHRLRREHPDAVIVLTGCMVQAFSKTALALTDADVIVGNTDVTRVVELTEQFFKDEQRICEITPHKKSDSFNTPNISTFAERTRAYMKIEDGCDRYCSYCIIPYARGFIRSKPLDQIKAEAETLAGQGFLEVVLVGINLSSYGKGTDFDLCDAVNAVAQVEGIKRIRLGSLEPDHISDQMLSRFKEQEKFCPQFHLSLQSGCDATLKRMNRHYDSAFYMDLVTRIRKSFPNASITTDIMVGFAGETEEEFNSSLAFFRSVGFCKAHVFSYSRRSGTVAYNMPNQVTNKEKAKRSHLMLEAAEQCEAEFLSKMVGQKVSVLFETYENGLAYGFTPNYCRVAVPCDSPLDRQIETVVIASYKDGCLNGTFV